MSAGLKATTYQMSTSLQVSKRKCLKVFLMLLMKLKLELEESSQSSVMEVSVAAKKHTVIKHSKPCHLYPYEYEVIRWLWIFPISKGTFLNEVDAVNLCNRLNNAGGDV